MPCGLPLQSILVPDASSSVVDSCGSGKLCAMDARQVSITIFVVPEPMTEKLQANYFVYVKQEFTEDANLQDSRFEKSLFDIAKTSPLRCIHLPWAEIERALLSIGAWHGEPSLDESQLQILFPAYYR